MTPVMTQMGVTANRQPPGERVVRKSVIKDATIALAAMTRQVTAISLGFSKGERQERDSPPTPIKRKALRNHITRATGWGGSQYQYNPSLSTKGINLAGDWASDRDDSELPRRWRPKTKATAAAVGKADTVNLGCISPR